MSFTLKQRFSLSFGLLFLIVQAVVLTGMYILFADYREADFEDRLQQKAESTLRLLVEVQEVDMQLLKIIDRNTIHKLYNEKTLIFDDKFELIYSSLDDAVLHWSRADLLRLRQEERFFKQMGKYDLLGLRSISQGRTYYILVLAEDLYGYNKLEYLRYLTIGAFVLGGVLVFALSFFIGKKGLEPLDKLNEQISFVTARNLSQRINVAPQNDEIGQLGQSFNQMLARIEVAYSHQKTFAANASHELRTPIARITTQLENINPAELATHTRQTLANILRDAYQLSDVVSSLLILSKIEERRDAPHFNTIRIEEVIFSCGDAIRKLYPDFKIQFDFAENIEEPDLYVPGDETLLGIAFNNLLQNAYRYSDNKTVNIFVARGENRLLISLTNTGTTPDAAEMAALFQAFKRGANAQQATGSGLGLSIVQRILSYHGASIEYEVPAPNTNRLVVGFSTLTRF